MPKKKKSTIKVKDRLDDNTIDLSLSEITEVPVRDIANYRRATVLDLSNNQITDLGKNFALLSHLVKLDLNRNRLKNLPDDFGKLTNLKHLDLYNNELVELPYSFGDLKNLRYLDLKSNPLSEQLIKIVGLCLTVRDCQTGAKNTVNYMYKLKLQHEQELEARQLIQDEPEKSTEIGSNATVVPSQSIEKQKSRTQLKKERREQLLKEQLDVNERLNGGDLKNHHLRDGSDRSSNDYKKNRWPFLFFLIIISISLVFGLIVVQFPMLFNRFIAIIPESYRVPLEVLYKKIHEFTL